MNFYQALLKSIFIFTLLIVIGCKKATTYNYQKQENGLNINLDSLTLNIEVLDKDIIHIKKVLPGVEPISVPDYVTVLEPQNVSWEVLERDELLIVSTAVIEVQVNKEGVIKYLDKEGNEFLAETQESSYIDENSEMPVSQAFLAGDEALYGLGQFQSGIMNWKNVPIRLQQYNQEIAIPFLVSTKNYGIYWHNYSLTDFNRPENEIGFTEVEQEKVIVVEKDKQVIPVDGEKENVAAYASEEAKEKNIRETTFKPTKTGEYTFLAYSNPGGRMRGEIKVTIDGDAIVNYSTIWMPRRYSGKKYLEAGKTYKVVFQNTGAKIPGKLFYNEPDFNKTVFSSLKGNTIDYYVIKGDNPAQVVAKNHQLTGETPMFSKKSYGFWQCRERYHNQEELLENAREMRKREIPVDNIVQDWFYWPKGTKGPEWDRVKYPDAKAMVRELDSLNLNLMVSVWPELKNKPLEEKYGLTKIKSSNYIDIYDKKVSEKFYEVLSDSMFQLGVKSIWLDGTEPEGVRDTKVNTAVGPFEQVRNPYSLEVTRAVYQGRRKEFPNERVFNLTRSAYSGQQRYGAASWSGDTEASWEQFSEQIAAGLNFTMAGVPYWTHDIGGFFRDSKSINPEFDNQYTNSEFIELLTRWFQFGTFSPIFRIHGYVSETEIWRYNDAFESTARKFIDLRYQLMPYIYSQAWQISKNSRQLMTPLVYHYPNDKNTWNVKDQLFFGESIMLGFVTEYKKRNMDMYLPEGSWYNYWTSKKVEGGRTISVKAELHETPMFVKAGSIIPMGAKVQYATQETKEPLVIKVYPGKDAKYVLYQDDNESYDYEKGEFSEVIITYSESNKEVSIAKGNGDYINFQESPMNLIIELVGGKKEQEATFKGESIKVNF